MRAHGFERYALEPKTQNGDNNKTSSELKRNRHIQHDEACLPRLTLCVSRIVVIVVARRSLAIIRNLCNRHNGSSQDTAINKALCTKVQYRVILRAGASACSGRHVFTMTASVRLVLRLALLRTQAAHDWCTGSRLAIGTSMPVVTQFSKRYGRHCVRRA